MPDLEGENVSLVDFRDEETLLLFWSPSCGYCQNMLPELKEWETNPPRGAPKLIVVSDGTVEANRKQGFRSPVVLDDGYRVSDAYGVPGTPSAVRSSDRRRPGGHAVSGGSLKRNRRIV